MGDSVREAVHASLQEVCLQNQLCRHQTLREDLGFDSLRLIVLVAKVSELLNIDLLEVQDLDFDGVQTVDDLVGVFEGIKQTSN